MEFDNNQDLNLEEGLPNPDDSQEGAIDEGTEPQGDQGTAGTEEGAAAAQDDDEGNPTNEGAEAQGEDEEFSLEYAFDDEIITVTDREEAATLMQQGRMYREAEEVLSAVNLISARTGTPPEKVVSNLLDALNKSDLERCIEEAGGDAYEGNRLYQQRLSDAQKVYDELRAKKTGAGVKERTEQRLADEFLKYKDELPYDKVSDIPQGVINICAKENQSLFAAELIYRHRENKKIQDNEAQKKTNQESAPGNIENGGGTDDFTKFSKALLDA